MFPAYFFDTISTSLSSPFDPGLPSSFLLGLGTIRSLDPLPDSNADPTQSPFAFAPLQDHRSFRIEALRETRLTRPTLTNGPISLRSPKPSFESIGFGSSFQARYHPLGLLFHEPLGTNFIMLLT